MQQQSRREFQIDEEAVATILANQLASEDGTPAHANMPYSRTGPMLIMFFIMHKLCLTLTVLILRKLNPFVFSFSSCISLSFYARI
jgi:hypothetical protein